MFPLAAKPHNLPFKGAIVKYRSVWEFPKASVRHGRALCGKSILYLPTFVGSNPSAVE
jgi:hypothetical protein